MPKKSELTVLQRQKIQLLSESGTSQVEIARIVKCSRHGVQTTLSRLRETGSHASRKGRGRKRKTTPRQDRALVTSSLRNRKKTSVELSAELSGTIGTPVSSKTVRRRLVEAGLKGCRARKKPLLSQKNRLARLRWAQKHRHWTEEDWTNILWSDESNFEIYGTPGLSFVRRRVGEEYHPQCVIPTVKHGGGSIMIWGCMGADGTGEMFICEGRMNTENYVNVLETKLFPSFTKVYGDTNLQGVKFQQDNAPCHKSRATIKWFEENNVELLEWPAQSPDLNPIEHLWSMLKRKVRVHPITSKDTLKNAIREEWEKISIEECRKLVYSLPKRIAAVIKNNGGPTKY